MSRMTKFLKQKCQVEAYALDELGKPERNRFGEIVYQEEITCACRREKITKSIQTVNGSIVLATGRYFLDEKVEILPDYRIDGCVVLTSEEYINGNGLVEGYEVYV